ncbi:MAG: 23S rRNA (guanosine(2251)-2'-O)-methyltransferase RlmB [Anaerolineae bacterium]|nr:23S rRNA (guanosine(2251)-2'-O)-methyltransferase RlmB [Anaerolineae bacterium]
MKEWVVGRNPVYEVLRAHRRNVFRLRIAKNTDQKRHLADVLNICAQKNIAIEYVPRVTLDTLGSHHQGVAVEISAYPYQTIFDILKRAEERREPPFILILDTVQDPRNLGAMLRSAEAVGVHGVVLPLRRTATVTPTVVNTSSGASEHLLIAQSNLVQALDEFKTSGIWVYGLESSSDAKPPNSLDLSGPIALVIGNEASGLRPLVRKTCDVLLELPMRGQVDSLNAAVAGSVALYFVWQARHFTS